jgi:hypothetical protein
MLRAGRRLDGRWYLGRGPGRGVWWCQESTCGAELAVGQLARALRSAAGRSDLESLRALSGHDAKLAVSPDVKE